MFNKLLKAECGFMRKQRTPMNHRYKGHSQSFAGLLHRPNLMLKRKTWVRLTDLRKIPRWDRVQGGQQQLLLKKHKTSFEPISPIFPDNKRLKLLGDLKNN